MHFDSPLHAPYCADRACWETIAIEENVQLARDTYRVRFRAPQIARRIVPGQFLMLRLAGWNDPLLGRPLALYDTVLEVGVPVGVDVVYLVLGKMTARLAAMRAGMELEVWGPLGNGFSTAPADHLVMVAGGIGQTPFMALARESLGNRQFGEPLRPVTPARRVTLCYGARTRDLLAGVPDFERLGVTVRTSTDDGSVGHHGLVTDLLRQEFEQGTAGLRVACCGPERMMESVAAITTAAGVPCELSLETPMACGIGICFSCVAKVVQPDGTWDYKRTCVEGPVFPAEKIVW